MDRPERTLSENLFKLMVAYLVDQQGGQVAVSLKEMDYKDCAVRIVFNPETEMLVATLMTEEAAYSPLPDDIAKDVRRFEL